MNEIKDTIDDYYDKDLPLIEELSEIKNNNNNKTLNYILHCLSPPLHAAQLITVFTVIPVFRLIVKPVE